MGPAGKQSMRPGTGYWLWLFGAIWAELGSTVTLFAITWTATGFGGGAAGLVATSTMLLRLVLLLGGGSTADRFGPRRVMITCDFCMLAVTLGMAAWFALQGPTVGSLLVFGCVLGIVSAFYMPASGVFPRLFVDDGQLGRVMATTSTGLQLARIAGPALGGILLAWIGLSWVVALNAATFLLVASIILFVVPPRPHRPPDSTPVGFRESWRDLKAAGHHRILVPLLVALGALVAGVTPAIALLIPLLSRDRGWSAASAGLMEGAFMAAALVVGALVATRGTLRRDSIPMIWGPVLAAAGLIGMAWAPAVWMACAAAATTSLGMVSFNCHALPRFLAASPPGAQARLQAVLAVTTTVPMLALSGPYGLLAQHASPGWALGVAAVFAAAAGVVVAITHPWTAPTVAPVG
ncbi:MFS transporter [Nakamurella sp. A5-74]|uniref:MFS transporter n=1 Tax=Nakamurella sp. A5-74 TaxID=3158264 RepID=A0AAU8DSS7_9ACTN